MSASSQEKRAISSLVSKSLGFEIYNQVLTKTEGKIIPFPFRHLISGVAGAASFIFPSSIRNISEGMKPPEMAFLQGIPLDIPNFALYLGILGSSLNLLPREMVELVNTTDTRVPFEIVAILGSKSVANIFTHAAIDFIKRRNNVQT